MREYHIFVGITSMILMLISWSFFKKLKANENSKKQVGKYLVFYTFIVIGILYTVYYLFLNKTVITTDHKSVGYPLSSNFSLTSSS